MSRSPLSGLRERRFLGLSAPAKINLFLHVTGRRPDGYHDLESVFVPIGLCDRIDLHQMQDGQLLRDGDLTGPVDQDLAWRAARLLQAEVLRRDPGQGAASGGARIRVVKQIPVGAGLGGGSSDAATTLLGLSRLWGLDWSRAELAALGRQLGADVPFFLGQWGAAFVEGLGDICTAMELPPRWFVVVFPGQPVATASVFSDPKLTRDHKKTTISGFSAVLHGSGNAAGEPPGWESYGCNDLEAVVRGRCQPVDDALRLLAPLGPVRMSGSGSSVFLVCSGEAHAGRVLQEVLRLVPANWQAWAVPALESLPLAEW